MKEDEERDEVVERGEGELEIFAGEVAYMYLYLALEASHARGELLSCLGQEGKGGEIIRAHCKKQHV